MLGCDTSDEYLSDDPEHRAFFRRPRTPDPSDRRLHRRFSYRIPAELKLGSTPVCAIQVVDFSLGGLQVAGDWRVLDSASLIAIVAQPYGQARRSRACVVRHGRNAAGIQLLDPLAPRETVDGCYVVELDLGNPSTPPSWLMLSPGVAQADSLHR